MNARAVGGAAGQGADVKRHCQANQPSREQLHRENERLLRENEELRRKVAEGERQIADAEKQIADAGKQIADLERQLALRKQNSTNSSKPPSSDGLAGEPRPRGRRNKSRRKAGGQPGHRGAHRPMVSAESVDETRPVLPEQCQHCGHLLPAQVEQVQTTGTPLGKYHLEVSHKQLPNAIVLLECERRSIRKRL